MGFNWGVRGSGNEAIYTALVPIPDKRDTDFERLLADIKEYGTVEDAPKDKATKDGKKYLITVKSAPYSQEVGELITAYEKNKKGNPAEVKSHPQESSASIPPISPSSFVWVENKSGVIRTKISYSAPIPKELGIKGTNAAMLGARPPLSKGTDYVINNGQLVVSSVEAQKPVFDALNNYITFQNSLKDAVKRGKEKEKEIKSDSLPPSPSAATATSPAPLAPLSDMWRIWEEEGRQIPYFAYLKAEENEDFKKLVKYLGGQYGGTKEKLRDGVKYIYFEVPPLERACRIVDGLYNTYKTKQEMKLAAAKAQPQVSGAPAANTSKTPVTSESKEVANVIKLKLVPSQIGGSLEQHSVVFTIPSDVEGGQRIRGVVEKIKTRTDVKFSSNDVTKECSFICTDDTDNLSDAVHIAFLLRDGMVDPTTQEFADNNAVKDAQDLISKNGAQRAFEILSSEGLHLEKSSPSSFSIKAEKTQTSNASVLASSIPSSSSSNQPYFAFVPLTSTSPAVDKREIKQDTTSQQPSSANTSASSPVAQKNDMLLPGWEMDAKSLDYPFIFTLPFDLERKQIFEYAIKKLVLQGMMNADDVKIDPTKTADIFNLRVKSNEAMSYLFNFALKTMQEVINIFNESATTEAKSQTVKVTAAPALGWTDKKDGSEFRWRSPKLPVGATRDSITNAIAETGMLFINIAQDEEGNMFLEVGSRDDMVKMNKLWESILTTIASAQASSTALPEDFDESSVVPDRRVSTEDLSPSAAATSAPSAAVSSTAAPALVWTDTKDGSDFPWQSSKLPLEITRESIGSALGKAGIKFEVDEDNDYDLRIKVKYERDRVKINNLLQSLFAKIAPVQTPSSPSIPTPQQPVATSTSAAVATTPIAANSLPTSEQLGWAAQPEGGFHSAPLIEVLKQKGVTSEIGKMVVTLTMQFSAKGISLTRLDDGSMSIVANDEQQKQTVAGILDEEVLKANKANITTSPAPATPSTSPYAHRVVDSLEALSHESKAKMGIWLEWENKEQRCVVSYNAAEDKRMQRVAEKIKKLPQYQSFFVVGSSTFSCDNINVAVEIAFLLKYGEVADDSATTGIGDLNDLTSRAKAFVQHQGIIGALDLKWQEEKDTASQQLSSASASALSPVTTVSSASFKGKVLQWEKGDDGRFYSDSIEEKLYKIFNAIKVTLTKEVVRAEGEEGSRRLVVKNYEDAQKVDQALEVALKINKKGEIKNYEIWRYAPAIFGYQYTLQMNDDSASYRLVLESTLQNVEIQKLIRKKDLKVELDESGKIKSLQASLSARDELNQILGFVKAPTAPGKPVEEPTLASTPLIKYTWSTQEPLTWRSFEGGFRSDELTDKQLTRYKIKALQTPIYMPAGLKQEISLDGNRLIAKDEAACIQLNEIYGFNGGEVVSAAVKQTKPRAAAEQKEVPLPDGWAKTENDKFPKYPYSKSFDSSQKEVLTIGKTKLLELGLVGKDDIVIIAVADNKFEIRTKTSKVASKLNPYAAMTKEEAEKPFVKQFKNFTLYEKPLSDTNQYLFHSSPLNDEQVMVLNRLKSEGGLIGIDFVVSASDNNTFIFKVKTESGFAILDQYAGMTLADIEAKLNSGDKRATPPPTESPTKPPSPAPTIAAFWHEDKGEFRSSPLTPDLKELFDNVKFYVTSKKLNSIEFDIETKVQNKKIVSTLKTNSKETKDLLEGFVALTMPQIKEVLDSRNLQKLHAAQSTQGIVTPPAEAKNAATASTSATARSTTPTHLKPFVETANDQMGGGGRARSDTRAVQPAQPPTGPQAGATATGAGTPVPRNPTPTKFNKP